MKTVAQDGNFVPRILLFSARAEEILVSSQFGNDSYSDRLAWVFGALNPGRT